MNFSYPMCLLTILLEGKAIFQNGAYWAYWEIAHTAIITEGLKPSRVWKLLIPENKIKKFPAGTFYQFICFYVSKLKDMPNWR